MSERFPTLGVVSSATGILVSDIGEVYDVLGYVLGDTLMTHQLPAAHRAAEASLRDQYPWLASLDPPRDDRDALYTWCEQIIYQHGETLELVPAVNADWAPGNALRDLVDIADGRPIIAVHREDGAA